MAIRTSNPATAQDVAQWLATLAGVSDVHPCTVFIGKQPVTKQDRQQQVFHGARYIRAFDPLNGAVNRRPNIQQLIYLLGPTPKIERPYCLTLLDDEREWYLAGYYDYSNDGERYLHRSHNPFGSFFQLAPWDTTHFAESQRHHKIDTGEPKPYTRVPMLVQMP